MNVSGYHHNNAWNLRQNIPAYAPSPYFQPAPLPRFPCRFPEASGRLVPDPEDTSDFLCSQQVRRLETLSLLPLERHRLCAIIHCIIPWDLFIFRHLAGQIRFFHKDTVLIGSLGVILCAILQRRCHRRLCATVQIPPLNCYAFAAYQDTPETRRQRLFHPQTFQKEMRQNA